jgi:hypothetical protein
MTDECTRDVWVVSFTSLEWSHGVTGAGVKVQHTLPCDTKAKALDLAHQIQGMLQEVKNPISENTGREWLEAWGLPDGVVLSFDGIEKVGVALASLA